MQMTQNELLKQVVEDTANEFSDFAAWNYLDIEQLRRKLAALLNKQIK